MTCLKRYLEPIRVAGEVLDSKLQAYRMDSTEANKKMRTDAGFGMCSCCDYFLLGDKSVILIEETQLTNTITRLKDEFSYLNNSDQIQIIKKLIKMENQNKVYGSILVILGLRIACNKLESIFENKSYVFWLVASGEGRREDHMFYEQMTRFILSDLRSQLSRQLVRDVKIIPADRLPDRIRDLM